MDFSHFITRWFQILCYFCWSLHKIHLVLPPQKKIWSLGSFQTVQGHCGKLFSKKIITLHSNNGGEYMVLKDYLFFHGISHYTTPPLHHIPLNTMATLKEDTAISLKLASPYSLMLHFQTPSGLMSLLLLFTSLIASNHHSQSILPIWINFSQKSQLL